MFPKVVRVIPMKDISDYTCNTNRVIATVYGKVMDSNYTQLLYANGDLDLRTVFGYYKTIY